MAQAIGVGVVAGFVGAVALVAAALYLFSHRRFSGGVTCTEAHIPSQASAPDSPDHDNELSSPPPVPRTGWDIIVENKWNDLSTRPDTLCGPVAISKNVGFEYCIETFLFNCITGRNPVGRGEPVQESIFDENQLIQLAGEPATAS
ncbi:hypothetical protein FALCPG4_014302 [Fusarium falciforme]